MQLKLIICCLAFVLLGQNSDKETISWSQTQRLTWADFRGTPNQNSSAVALSASGITFGYSLKTSGNIVVSYNTSVEALFYPNKSWKKEDRSNTYILGHEQLHFDITELYVRMFRAKIAKLRVNQNIKAQLKELHTAINEALDATQKQYDAQTNHSINKDTQKQWETFIKRELKTFEEFKSI